MKMTEIFLQDLTSEVERSRRALEQVPDGNYDWKPHEKSMKFGYLVELVAIMPSWVATMITQDELDVAPANQGQKPEPMRTRAELLAGLDKTAAVPHARRSKGPPMNFEDSVETAGTRPGGNRSASQRNDPRHLQASGASPRPDDRLPSPVGRFGSSALRALGRRQPIHLGAAHATRRVLSQPGSQGHRGLEGVLREAGIHRLRRRCLTELADNENGTHVIGLFQGMFERNMLTFNPGWDSDAQKLGEFSDVRELQRQLRSQGVDFKTEADESTSGPASFVTADPDGNPILFDQHV